MKPTKKKPAKRRNPIVSKLLDLKYKINEAYQGDTVISSNREDKAFVIKMIDRIRNNQSVDKDQMEYCNKLWRDYA